jgi:hypothetical protein
MKMWNKEHLRLQVLKQQEQIAGLMLQDPEAAQEELGCHVPQEHSEITFMRGENEIV